MGDSFQAQSGQELNVQTFNAQRERDRQTQRETTADEVMFTRFGGGGGIFSDAKSPVFRRWKILFLFSSADRKGGGSFQAQTD